jgi:hypothetical protein
MRKKGDVNAKGENTTKRHDACRYLKLTSLRSEATARTLFRKFCSSNINPRRKVGEKRAVLLDTFQVLNFKTSTFTAGKESWTFRKHLYGEFRKAFKDLLNGI